MIVVIRLLATPVSTRTEVPVVDVAPDILERYVGTYQLAPVFAIVVTREGGRLFIQATGQPRLEVFASSEREFFLKAVNAQITFEVGDAGRARALLLHQNGATQRASRKE